MPFTPLTFTGISAYSDDLNTVLQRAVSIAKLPLTALQNQDADVLAKKTALSTLTAAIASLGSSVADLGTVAANKALAANSSNSSKVSVSNSGATSPASYTISEISSVAQAASERSVTGYADPAADVVSASGTVKLVFGGQTHTFNLTPEQNNLTGLRDLINGLGWGLNATVLTTGTGLTPNYLSVTSNTFGATTLQLIEDPDVTATNLLTSSNQGSNANFKLNGIDVSKSSNVINDVISGATFTILDKTAADEIVTLAIQTDRSQLKSGIQSFVTKYNALVDAVGAQVGPNAGLLSGDFLVRETQNDLRQLAGFTGSGSIKSLAELGVQLGKDGKILFNDPTFVDGAPKFDALSDSQISAAFDFFGSASTGFAALAKKFTQISDPVTGLAKLQQDNYDQADTRLQKEIDALSDRVSNLQVSVQARLQAADALLAQLDSQQRILTASIDALNTVTFGRKTN